jgi:ATP-binding cassette subfamily C protein CydC
MIPLVRIARLLWQEERAALWRGLLLSVAVLAAGAALLGLSGWFITAAGAAGVAGIGIAFDVFRPSAGVRFLALGRTAARYGERVLTHDATLRVLARLRVRILGRLADESPPRLARLRSPALLNRVTADVDALDGLAIRLIFPVVAGAGTLGLAGVLIGWLVSPAVAAVTVGILATGAAVVIAGLGRQSIGPAATAEAARQDLRASAIEHFRGRIALAFSGALPGSRDRLLRIEAGLRASEMRLSRLDGRAAATVSLTGVLAAGAALGAGGFLALNGHVSPAVAAIAVFAALALIEVLAPLQRGVAEIGRMRDAAGRIAPLLDDAPRDHGSAAPVTRPPQAGAPLLRLDGLSFGAPGSPKPLTRPIFLDVSAGETVALTGRSGTGKTSLLSTIAGLSTPLGGSVEIDGRPAATLGEASLREILGYLPQRSQLMSGTVRDNLLLAAPGATDTEMTDLVGALGLSEVLGGRGGLDAALGEGGSGLSGGEARRLALARVLLRRPRVLLLDEPTEGLDATSAARALAAVRGFLPDAAILIATHKTSEAAVSDRVLRLKDIN